MCQTDAIARPRLPGYLSVDAQTGAAIECATPP
jgi:hypothetical protein